MPIAQILLCATVAGYAVLTTQLLRSRMALQFRVFTLYCAVMVAFLLFWDPRNVPRLLAWEPVMLTLRVGIVAEAYLWVAGSLPREERRRLLSLLAFIASVALLFSWGYFEGSRPADLLRAGKQYVHVWLAAACLFGVVCLWMAPPLIQPAVRRHGLILTGYMLTYAVIGFVRFGKGQLDRWIVVNCLHFALSVVWIGCWLLLARRRL